MNTLIVGHGGRESVLAKEMGQGSKVYAVMGHMNPSICDIVWSTNGAFTIWSITNPNFVADFAVSQGIDMAMVSSDEPLAAGVVDSLKAKNIPTVWPTKKGAEIEWNKEFSRRVVELIAPEANPMYRIAHSPADIESIFQEFGEKPVAVKPQWLTWGKWVKVVWPHLRDNTEAKQYALSLLNSWKGSSVIIEEKITWVEFTIQGISDGNTIQFPPATYDYPYRFTGDAGPGTGGMWCYTARELILPFMTQAHYDYACVIMQKAITFLREHERQFSGVLNAGFFITQSGELKVIEFNARFGDPESINIMNILQSNWLQIMHAITEWKLHNLTVKFKNLASSVIYLVSPDYAIRAGKERIFSVDVPRILENWCHVDFSAAERLSGNEYRTIGNSRSVAISAESYSSGEATKKIIENIQAHVTWPLEYRSDIWSDEYIQKTIQLLTSQ